MFTDEIQLWVVLVLNNLVDVEFTTLVRYTNEPSDICTCVCVGMYIHPEQTEQRPTNDWSNIHLPTVGVRTSWE